MIDQTSVDSFTAFVEKNERSLQQALCATFGRDRGLEATAEAFMYAWENWDQVEKMDNPAGYLYRVARTKARKLFRKPPILPAAPSSPEMPWVEPGLPDAVGRLSDNQRVTVVLVHALGWTQAEVARFLGISHGSVQKHAERGLSRLRRSLGGTT